MFNSINISSSGLSTQKLRMDVISQNIANINTTRTEDGTPYKRKVVLIEEKNQSSFKSMLSKYMNTTSDNSGVRATKITEDNAPFKKVYDPGHPDANEDGYVEMPNVSTIDEMVNLIDANRSYEANVTVMNSSKSMAMKALEIGK